MLSETLSLSVQVLQGVVVTKLCLIRLMPYGLTVMKLNLKGAVLVVLQLLLVSLSH